MARRSDNPTPGALATRQCRALRNAGYSFSRMVTNGAVLTMLVQRGHLPRRDWHTDVEIERGLTRWALQEAGEPVEENMKRISSLVGERWHSAGN